MTTQQKEHSIQSILAGHEEAYKASFGANNLKVLDEIVRLMVQVFKNGKKILLCGNGGSAADSQHIAAEFIGRFKKERKSLPAIALTTDTSILTAVSNDYSYETVFARQVEGLGQKGDLLIAISTSGTSKNILAAAKKAKELGVIVVGFTGKNWRDLQKISDVTFLAGSEKTSHIQEMHITALHAISEVVENSLYPS